MLAQTDKCKHRNYEYHSSFTFTRSSSWCDRRQHRWIIKIWTPTFLEFLKKLWEGNYYCVNEYPFYTNIYGPAFGDMTHFTSICWHSAQNIAVFHVFSASGMCQIVRCHLSHVVQFFDAQRSDRPPLFDSLLHAYAM